jgi:non-heme Fe2+,alpha-ketoglutarate-dependent halogenase
MERDLRFFPVPESRSREALTLEQVRTFNRDGCLPQVRMLSDPEVFHVRGVFEQLLSAYIAKGFGSYDVNNCQATSASLYDLCRHPRIVSVVADILGDSFALWSTHFFCKLPGDVRSVTWHQDAPYWPFTPSKTVTVWLAIDDSDLENGAMRYIPGSHLLGALPMRDSRPDEQNVLSFTVDQVEQHGQPKALLLKAGEASLHSDMLLHGSPPNPSQRRRCGLTLRYCTLDVRVEDGWNQSSIIIRGSDPSGHWGWVKHRPPGDSANIRQAPNFGAN